MRIFFNNPDLAPIREHFSFKSVDEMRALLTDLLYAKITWWTKSISIRLVITDLALKKYLMYFLDIRLAICFLINYRSFV